MSAGLKHNLAGQRFGFLVAIVSVRGRGWAVRCDCGSDAVASSGNLRAGRKQTCGNGCPISSGLRSVAARTHGENGKTKEYRTWHSMTQRCEDKRSPGYIKYGMRGISVCDRWRESYESFLIDMGRAPSPRHSIDRIDNNGNYELRNCRWATASQQQRNKRTTLSVTFKGKTMSLAEACEQSNIAYGTAQSRISRGWNADDALTLPVAANWSAQKKNQAGNYRVERLP